MLPALRLVESGIVFEARVSPGARRTRLVGLYGERLKLQVAAPAEDGKANLALRRWLAERLEVTLDAVEILRGQTARDKTILVRGVEAEAFRRALEVPQSSR